jgi:hypothetical protein
MFVFMRSIAAAAADTIDLMIEFSTLGEYGLEYPAESSPGYPRNHHPVETAGRQDHARRPARVCGMASERPVSRMASRGRRPSRRVSALPEGRTRPAAAYAAEPDSRRCRGSHRPDPAAPIDYRAALRTPRIELNLSRD